MSIKRISPKRIVRLPEAPAMDDVIADRADPQLDRRDDLEAGKEVPRIDRSEAKDVPFTDRAEVKEVPNIDRSGVNGGVSVVKPTRFSAR